MEKNKISYYVLGAAWYDSENENNPDQSERFIINGVWENGYTDKFIEVVKGVSAGDKVAIKSSYATKDRKSMLRIKATGVVDENPGDGRKLKILWDEKFTPFDLEGYGGYRNTIQKVANEDIDAIFNHSKSGFYDELNKFLKQAETGEQKTSHFIKEYFGLTVKVSFGKGNQARIPWVAFLNDIDSVQQGIYPVYLYFKENGLLILAYGVSETHNSKRSWNIVDKETINQYFSKNDLGKPERYGSSFVFKTYNVKGGIEEKTINYDLMTLLQAYKSNSDIATATPPESFRYLSFHNKTKEAGLKFSQKIICRFMASLFTKPFVICSGLSGSGKTKLAQSFVKWICKTEEQYKIVPVGADWTNREPLLGFPNGLDSSQYVFPDSGVLQLIISANKNENKNRPYFLILDEMNLSHVERYFADFLSIMESHDKIKLYSGDDRFDSKDEKNKIDKEISWPHNLFIIGTVNIDETTYMFSPKVLDRANVIEFRISVDEMTEYLKETSIVDMSNFINPINNLGYGSSMGFDFLEKSNKKLSNQIAINETLLSFFEELRKCGAEFGFRSASEISRLISVLSELRKESAKWDEVEISDNDFIDIAIMQKLLPKLHGSRKKLVGPLETLAGFCLARNHGSKSDEQNVTKTIYQQFIAEKRDLAKWEIKYPISFEKIERMHKNVIDNGFTSYAEA